MKRGRPEIEDDVAFFARRPKRSYRVRAASRAEIAKRVADYKYPSMTPDGFHYVSLIHKISPGRLDYLFVVGSADLEDERPEDYAQGLWEMFAHRSLLCLRLDILGDSAWITCNSLSGGGDSSRS